jgi:ABC transporter substrate binding protein
MGYPEGDKQAQAGVIALRKGLQSVGWIEGRNVQSDYRWAGPDADKARTFAKELVGMSPDVIVSSTNQVTAILQQETRTIPIVFAFVGDPVGSGFVQTLSKPGGNLTGFANFENSIGGKWLAAATASGLALIPLPVNNAADIERGVTAFAAERNGGLIVAPHAVTLGNRDLIDRLALKYRLPAVYSDRYFYQRCTATGTLRRVVVLYPLATTRPTCLGVQRRMSIAF